jgi:hypothetical protein
MGLPVPGESAAVIIGVSSYAKKSPFSDLPAVSNNVADLAKVLTDPKIGHLTRDRCQIIHNRTSPMAVLKEIRREAAKATDTFTIYFAGHGELGRDGSLYLMLRNGNHDDLSYTGIDFEQIREIMVNCRARRRIVILDCCYSGSAIGQFMSDDEQLISNQTQISGTYTLTSSGQNKPSIAPEGEAYTAFTGELIGLLEEGLPGKGEFLTLSEIFPVLRDRLAAAKRPKPLQRWTQEVGGLALTRNAAFLNASYGAQGFAYERSSESFSEAAYAGSWLGGVDRKQGIAFTSSAPPLPSLDPPGLGGIPSILSWTIIATVVAWDNWFSVVYAGLLVAGAVGIVLETEVPGAVKSRRIGLLFIVAVVVGYGALAVVDLIQSRVSSAFWDIVSVILYMRGISGRVRYRSESATRAKIRLREEAKPEYQRIAEWIESSPIAARLEVERWLGQPIDRPVFDVISNLPGARFIAMRDEVEAVESSGPAPGSRKPDYVAVCGRRVAAIYYVAWPGGMYRRYSGPTKDLRRNGKSYDSGRLEVAEIADGLSALRISIKESEIVGLIIVKPEESSKADGSDPRNVYVVDENIDGEDLILTVEGHASDLIGPFLAKEPHAIDLDVIAALLDYATVDARVDAGLSRHGSRRL